MARQTMAIMAAMEASFKNLPLMILVSVRVERIGIERFTCSLADPEAMMDKDESCRQTW